MNLAKAKELLKDLDKRGHFSEGDDITTAIRLHLEAINWMLLARVHSPGTVPELLHGETKE